MWVERVSARAFGPFRDAVLELAPGLTAIVGPNESGKSTWHAALRLALTGVRRGRGARTSLVRELEERHRPWDDAEGSWAVEARLHLDDGREIEISQDLAGKVACRAVDVVLGRDVSSEIIVDGSPDASRWLGLDRDAFAATVSVDQGRILAVLEAADGLQDDMQRAAATAGRDATAAEAIAHLTEFRRAGVGADTRPATGPLRRGRRAVADAEAALATARTRHAAHLARSAEAQDATAVVAAARAGAARARAVVERSRAEAIAARASRAAEIADRHPEPPLPLEDAERETAAVAAALEAWRGRPRSAVLEGHGSDELERRLAAVPPPPEGDIAPDPGVLAAVSALDQAEGAAAELAGGPEAVRPSATGEPAAIGSGRTSVRGDGLAVGLAGIAVVAGVSALVQGAAVVGSVLIGMGVALGAWVGLRRRRDAVRGLPEALRAKEPAGWEQRRADAVGRVALADEALRTALRSRGAAADGDLRAAVSAYTTACSARAEQAALAAQADSLRRELDARRQLEGTAAERAAAVARAEAEVRAAAQRVGQLANGHDPDALVADLEAWQRERTAALRVGEEAIAEWQELTDLLSGRSLAELQAEAAEATRRALAAEDSTTMAFPIGSMAAPPSAVAEEVLATRQAELRAAERTADILAGEVRQLSVGLPNVAEAEEALEATQAELSRVLLLADVLDQTLALLRSAEEQVHRDLAPVLADAVERWLPTISGGAYTEAAVDPSQLGVRVKEAATGQWRDARRLSEGTREQVYLLLRVAMTQHLVTTNETAPLLLDEVTAQSDDARRAELLAMLHELSRERQVVVFTHDEHIAEWTDAHLDPGRDAVVRLAGRAGEA